MAPGREQGTGERAETAELLRQWAERDRMPRLLIDEQLAVLWSNRAAQVLLAERRDLEVRESRLCATHAGHHQALAAFVQSCGSGIATTSIPCENGDGHVLIRCVELSSDFHSRYFGMNVFRSGSEFRVTYADLETVFNLTKAEHKVLLQLLDGHTADEIAALLSVSIETTRSHIRQIYAKLDVTSREGMFSRVRPYRL